jgi:hypothetical protein
VWGSTRRRYEERIAKAEAALTKVVRQRDLLKVYARKAQIDVDQSRLAVKAYKEIISDQRETIADLRATVRDLTKQEEADGPSLAMVRAKMYMDQLKAEDEPGALPLSGLRERIDEVYGGAWEPPEMGEPEDIFGKVKELQETGDNDQP